MSKPSLLTIEYRPGHWETFKGEKKIMPRLVGHEKGIRYVRNPTKKMIKKCFSNASPSVKKSMIKNPGLYPMKDFLCKNVRYPPPCPGFPTYYKTDEKGFRPIIGNEIIPYIKKSPEDIRFVYYPTIKMQRIAFGEADKDIRKKMIARPKMWNMSMFLSKNSHLRLANDMGLLDEL